MSGDNNNGGEEEEGGKVKKRKNGAMMSRQNSSTTFCSEEESNCASQEGDGEDDEDASKALNLNGKTRASRGAATDPQSLYARVNISLVNAGGKKGKKNKFRFFFGCAEKKRKDK